ncbi:MAG: hypothetical protein GW875_05910 [Deltaproteobacteria bacterium]|nr:hypothetical protein [Deltaproteobacteria bacterium]NCP02670.1 hypothetical protein [Deltaproteobacteria bacterium]
MPRTSLFTSGLRRLLLLALLALVLGGCSAETRYSVLTFFFTGVPPLHGPSPEELAAQQAAAAEQAAAQPVSAEEQARLAALKPYDGPYVHGPYAAEECEQCHVMAVGGFSFGAKADPNKKNIVPGRFQRTPGELCGNCHRSKSAEAAYAAGLNLHGPVGVCTNCHYPHSGRYPFFVRAAGSEICRRCHSTGFIQDSELHEGLTECLECHNPHMGLGAAMLRDEHAELL